MWHRRRRYPFKGLLFLFLGLLFFSGFGKSGFGSWVAPMILLWIFVPMAARAFRPRRRPMHDVRIPPEAIRKPRRKAATPRPPAPGRTPPGMKNNPRHSLTGLPANCPACGGPADSSTLRWRGDRPYCGYCGTGL